LTIEPLMFGRDGLDFYDHRSQSRQSCLDANGLLQP
jgi:hypothetical protein